MSRKIAITLRSADAGNIPVSLPTVVRTLGALQDVVRQIGEMLTADLAGDDGARPSAGRSSQSIHDVCDLRLVGLSYGSASVVLEVPEPPPTLFDEDIGLQALDVVHSLTREVTDGAEWDSVQSILPREEYRDLILRNYKDICPMSSERTLVYIGDPENPQVSYQLDASTRSRALRLAAQVSADDVVEERRLIGKVNLIQEDPPRLALLLPGKRHLPVPTDRELMSAMHQLWGQLITVSVICRVNRHPEQDDAIAEIKDVVDFSPVDETPLVVSEISLPEGDVPLCAPIEVRPTFSDNLFTFEYEPLGIAAYAADRSTAVQAFQDELTWLWQEYAQAPDGALAADALAVKRRLRDLVERRCA